MPTSKPIAAPVDATAALNVMTAWDLPGLVHGFCGRTGGVSADPFATFNLAGWVGDAPDAVAENWRRWHLRHPHLPVVRVRQVHGKLVHRIDATQPDSLRLNASRIDSVRSDSAEVESAPPGDSRPEGDVRTDGQRSEIGRSGGNDIEVVGPAHVGPEGDGMVTAATGLALGIFTADCVPILMVDAERRIVAALHAGWRGTLAGIAAAGVHAMVALGARPASIRAALGPSIGLCCFEVDAALAETFAREIPGATAHARPGGSHPRETHAAAAVRPTDSLDQVPGNDAVQHDGVRARSDAARDDATHRDGARRDAGVQDGARRVRSGKSYLDLRAILRLQLEREDLNPSSIANVGPCTRCAKDLFFSRRGAGGVTSGLQLSFIGFTR
jgi:YfiH family protein